MREVIIKTEVVKTQKLVVTQANALARAVQTMTLQEKRLLLLVMAWIRHGDTNFRTYRIPITEICRMLDIRSKDAYARLRSIARKLMSRVVEVEDGHGGWEMFQWVSRAAYVPRDKPDNPIGTAYLEVRLHEDMMPLLLELSREFASVSFAQLASFRSFHALRVFEILYHECHSFSRKTLEFDLADLKRRLGIADKYPNFADFERRVLKPAQQDCVERSPLRFSYKKRKIGKKITALVFSVKQNSGYQLELDFLPDTIEVQTVRELGAPVQDRGEDAERDATAEMLRDIDYFYDPHETVELYGADLVRDTIRLAREKQRQAATSKRPIRNLPGLVKTMLENGTAKGVAKKARVKSRKKRIEEGARELEVALQAAQVAFLDQVWDGLNDEMQHRVHDLIHEESTPFVLAQLEKGGWSGSLYTSTRRQTLRKHDLVTLPADLKTARAFAQTQSDFLEQPLDVQAEILKRIEAGASTPNLSQ